MRTLSHLVLVLFLTCSSVLSDTCNRPTNCPPSPAQVPLPYYSLTFDSPPTSAVTYGYSATDADGCGHTGLAVMGATTSPLGYIDLVNTSSAQSATSVALPALGPSTVGGSLSTYSRGWTFEVTFKPTAQTTWGEVFCIGNGAGGGDILLGYSTVLLELYFAVNTADGNNSAWTGTSYGTITPALNPSIVLQSWLHFVVVIQQVDTAGLAGNWFTYINGHLINGTGTSQFNIPDTPRPLSYIGRSCPYDDSIEVMQMEVDTFRIYNQALNADQVTSLYAQQMGQCSIVMTANPTLTSSFPHLMSNATSTPTPVWGVNFTTNPTAAVGSGVTPSYTWASYDEGDASCGLSSVHQGLVVFSSGYSLTHGADDGVPSWIDLTATSGPNAIANNPSPLPQLGGLSSSSGAVASGTAGLSFEVTFKPGLHEPWAKVFDMGGVQTGQGWCGVDLVFGSLSDSRFMTFQMCDQYGNLTQMGQWGPILAGHWSHVVIVIQQLNNGNAIYAAYTNGQLLSVLSNGPYPPYVARQLATLGKWNAGNNVLWSGWIDTFNIYNVALSPSQVANLSSAALGPSGVSACAFTPSITPTIPSSALYYDLSFPTNPAVTNQAYTWLAYDPTDSPANQLVHRGLVNLSGCIPGTCNGTYINMSAPTGPHSAGVGKVLGDVGGIGSGSINDNTVGWSFEFTFKPYGAQTWGRMMDLGNGMGTGEGEWELYFGWHGTDQFYSLGVLLFSSDFESTLGLTYLALGYLWPATPTLNTSQAQWLHAIAILQYNNQLSETSAGSYYASYSVYLNGQLTGNYPYMIYPDKVRRINANLGKSNYGDSYWQGLIDTFRVYSIALNPNQVQTLYQASLLSPPPPRHHRLPLLLLLPRHPLLHPVRPPPPHLLCRRPPLPSRLPPVARPCSPPVVQPPRPALPSHPLPPPHPPSPPSLHPLPPCRPRHLVPPRPHSRLPPPLLLLPLHLHPHLLLRPHSIRPPPAL
jgi:hypothetical protein